MQNSQHDHAIHRRHHPQHHHFRCLGLCLALAFGPCAADQGWEKVNEKHGIQVFTQPVKDSPILRVKTVTVMQAPLPRIRAILDQVEQRPRWFPYLEACRVLQTVDSRQRIEYSLFSAPWPASDRDFVYRVTTLEDGPQRITYRMVSEPHSMMPEHPARVRAQLMESVYSLTTQDDEHTQVELIFYADPQGWLPDWIINIIQRVLPYLILRNLAETAEHVPVDDTTAGEYPDAN